MKLKKIRNLSIKFKTLIVIGGSILIALFILFGIIFYQFNQLETRSVEDIRDVITENDKLRVEHLVKTKAQSLGTLYEEFEGELGEDELQEFIADLNNEVWFDDDGYFFIYDFEGNTISLPPNPEIQGDNRWDLTDTAGNYLVRDLTAAAQAGGDFVEWYYLNPDTGEEELKFGYVEQIPGTDWYIGTGSYYTFIESNVETASRGMIDYQNNILRFILIAFIVVLIVISLVIFKYSNYLIEQINRVVTGIKKLADGKLNVVLEVESEDEIGEFCSAFNKAIKNQKDLIRSIHENVEELLAHSEELSASSQQGNANIETTNNVINNMSASIQQISASAQEVASFSQEANLETDSGRENIEATIESIEEIDQSAGETVEVINELDQNSEEIGQIVELITNIAEQTNLLALNAAIEAARAGEHGRGFAVVADEIRSLASETSDATEKIDNLVTKTQQQSQKGLKKVTEVKDKASEGREVAEKTGDAFKEIQNSVKETANQIEQTANAANDLAKSSDSVISNTDDIASMSNEVTQSAQELARMAQELQSLVENFDI